MAIVIPPGVVILIMLPYFAVTILVVYTHKRLEKSKDNDSDNNSKDIVSDNEND